MKTNKALRIANILLGLASVGFFIYDWILLKRIRPLMDAWGTLTERDNDLFLLFGIGLLMLFITQFNVLDEVIRYLWLPLYLFGVIFLFSASNLLYSKKA